MNGIGGSRRYDLESTLQHALPGVARLPSQSERGGTRYQRFYAAFESLGTGSAPPQVRDFSFQGDHIFCSQKAGGMAVGVRFGVDSSNPYLPLRQGAIYRGEFSKVRLRQFNTTRTLFAEADYAEIELIVSRGPLIAHWPDNEHGFRAPSFHRDTRLNGAGLMVATPAPIRIPEPSYFGLAPNGPHFVAATVGRFGGTLIVRNEDMANELHVGFQNRGGAPITITETEIIYPGERVEYPLDGNVGRFRDLDLGTAAWWVMTAVGSCPFSYGVSCREVSLLDPNQRGWEEEPPW